MIDPISIRYLPAIHQFHHLTKMIRLSNGLSVLNNEAVDQLIASLSNQDSITVILDQQLFGSLSGPLASNQTYNTQKQAAKKKTQNSARASHHKSASSTQPKFHRQTGEATKTLAKSQTEHAQGTLKRDKPTTHLQCKTTDAVACIERLWEQWLNKSATSKNELSQNRQRGNQDLQWHKRQLTHDDKPLVTTPASKDSLSKPAVHLMRTLQRVFIQIPTATSGVDTIIDATPSSITESTIHETKISHPAAIQMHDSSSPPLLTQTPLTKLVNRLWQLQADGEITGNTSSRQTNRSTSNKPGMTQRTSTVKHHFQSEVAELVKTMQLKPITSAPAKKVSPGSTEIKTMHHSQSAENEILETVNQMLLEQARRNGVDIS